MSLTFVNFVNQCAQFHIILDDREKKNQEAFVLATFAMLLHAFQNMNMHRVEFTVIEDDFGARQLLEEIG